MRLATATGMGSVDEVKEGGPQVAGGDAAATQGQRDLIRNLCRSPLMSEEEHIRLNQQLQEGLGKRRASELIDRIKAKLDGRRNGTAKVDGVAALES